MIRIKSIWIHVFLLSGIVFFPVHTKFQSFFFIIFFVISHTLSELIRQKKTKQNKIYLESVNKIHYTFPVLAVLKKLFYFGLPYFWHSSVQMKINLSYLIGEYFPKIDPQIILDNKFEIVFFFQSQRLSTECSQIEFSSYVLLRQMYIWVLRFHRTLSPYSNLWAQGCESPHRPPPTSTPAVAYTRSCLVT